MNLESLMFDAGGLLSCLMVQGPGNHTITPVDAHVLNSEVPHGSSGKPFNFKPVSMVPKVIKHIKNAKTLILQSPEFNFCEKLVFETHCIPKYYFKSPKHPDFD